ncbi:hypothetical protein BT69DRAFT_1288257 [Atractiella rhizophila]|nr:hypothetical protein BT69DRAFT_1288257 [Atractiella rhizophila]
MSVAASPLPQDDSLSITSTSTSLAGASATSTGIVGGNGDFPIISNGTGNGDVQAFGGEGQGEGWRDNSKVLNWVAVVIIVVVLLIIVFWRLVYVRRLRRQGTRVSFFLPNRRIRIPFTQWHIGRDVVFPAPRATNVDMQEVGRGDGSRRRRRRRRRRDPMTGPEIGEGGRRGGERDDDLLDEEEWEFDGDGVASPRAGGASREREELPEYFRRDAALPSYNRTMLRDRGIEEMENLHEILFYRPARNSRNVTSGDSRRNSRLPSSPGPATSLPTLEDISSTALNDQAMSMQPSPTTEPNVLSIEDYERRTRGQRSERDPDDEDEPSIPTRADGRGLPPRYSLDAHALSRPQAQASTSDEAVNDASSSRPTTPAGTRSPSPTPSDVRQHQSQPSGSSVLPSHSGEGMSRALDSRQSHLSNDSIHTLCSKTEDKPKDAASGKREEMMEDDDDKDKDDIEIEIEVTSVDGRSLEGEAEGKGKEKDEDKSS